MKLNKKVRNLGIIFGVIVGITAGCSSTEEPKEDLRTFAITDRLHAGELYMDLGGNGAVKKKYQELLKECN